MYTNLIAGSIDIAELMVYIFFLFFLGLVIYLRREDRREGYPVEDDIGGRLRRDGTLINTALPKTFNLPFDQGSVTAPNNNRDPIEVANSRRVSPWPGAPIEPVGDPIMAGVGPGARAHRSKFADVTAEGHLRIVQLVMRRARRLKRAMLIRAGLRCAEPTAKSLAKSAISGLIDPK